MDEIGMGDVIDVLQGTGVIEIECVYPAPTVLDFIQCDEITAHTHAFQLRKTCAIEQGGIIRFDIMEFSGIVIIEQVKVGFPGGVQLCTVCSRPNFPIHPKLYHLRSLQPPFFYGPPVVACSGFVVVICQLVIVFETVILIVFDGC